MYTRVVFSFISVLTHCLRSTSRHGFGVQHFAHENRQNRHEKQSSNKRHFEQHRNAIAIRNDLGVFFFKTIEIESTGVKMHNDPQYANILVGLKRRKRDNGRINVAVAFIMSLCRARY